MMTPKQTKEYMKTLTDEGKECYWFGLELDRLCDEYDKEQELKKWRPHD